MVSPHHRFTVIRLAIVILLFAAAWGGHVTAGVSPTEEAVVPGSEDWVATDETPPGTDLGDGFFVEDSTTFVVPDGIGSNSQLQSGFVVMVTMLPGASAPGTNTLGAWFTLEVKSGAICYTHVSDPDQTATVFVKTPANGDASTACAADGTEGENLRTDCGGDGGCLLNVGDTVHLPDGSLLLHSGQLAEHTYRNASDAEWALVVLTGYESPGAPGCTGTCWRW